MENQDYRRKIEDVVKYNEPKSTLETLLKTYEKYRAAVFATDVKRIREVVYAVEDELKSLLSEINYSEKDISNLVATAQMWNSKMDKDESKAFGAYVGSLITILTERNEAKGKRTIIKIDENRLDYLGYCCRKFDLVWFGVNKGDSVFACAKDGNELYVERCEGDEFASGAGWGSGYVGKIIADRVDGNWFAIGAGHVGEIRADTVNGEGFACDAGSYSGYSVGEISAVVVNGEEFAESAGSDGGHVGKIRANTVNGKRFAYRAGSRGGRVDKISADFVNGDWFASYVGWKSGYVGEISADFVKGDAFAESAGSNGGRVGEIGANTVNGDYFAILAGSEDGHVDRIIANTVNGSKFAWYAGSTFGDVGEISVDTVNGDWFAGYVGPANKISAGTVNGKYFAYHASADEICVRKISEEVKATMNPCQWVRMGHLLAKIVIGDCAEEAEK